jgi:hypothetical protein
MKVERTISAYKDYFRDFISSLSEAEARKVFYVIDMLKTQERVNAKFVINKAIQLKKEYYAAKR